MKLKKFFRNKKNRPKIALFCVVIVALIAILLASFLLIIKLPVGQGFSEEKAAQTMKNICGQSLECYKGQFNKLAKQRSFNEVQGTLFALQKINLATAGDCHMIAHIISQIETAKDFSKWTELLKGQGTQVCAGGFIHGIIEEHMFKNNQEKINNQLMDEVCSLVSTAFGQWNCMHMMGHLILVQEMDNVPAAVSLCNTVLVSQERYSCNIGVFMEHNTKLNLISHGIIRAFKSTEKDALEMEKLCNTFKVEEASIACWSEMSRIYLGIFNNDVAKAISACDKAPKDAYAQNCKTFVSAFWIFRGEGDRASNMKMVCSYFKELSVEWKDCVSATISVLLDGSIEYAPDVIKYCGDINYVFRENCFITVGTKLSEKVDLAKRQELCSLAPEETKKACTLHY